MVKVSQGFAVLFGGWNMLCRQLLVSSKHISQGTALIIIGMIWSLVEAFIPFATFLEMLHYRLPSLDRSATAFKKRANVTELKHGLLSPYSSTMKWESSVLLGQTTCYACELPICWMIRVTAASRNQDPSRIYASWTHLPILFYNFVGTGKFIYCPRSQ
jgi:hypothetical protein